MEIVDKVAWLLLKDGKVLSTLSKGKETFYFPGGKREFGESDIECLVREIKEELTVELIPDTLTYFGAFEAQSHGYKKGIKIRMICYFSEFIGVLTPSNEIKCFQWLSYGDKLKSSPVDQIIFDSLFSKGMLAIHNE